VKSEFYHAFQYDSAGRPNFDRYRDCWLVNFQLRDATGLDHP
jgi:hypothetical protein